MGSNVGVCDIRDKEEKENCIPIKLDKDLRFPRCPGLLVISK